MNKDKIRLVIQTAFKTGLALCGIAIGGAVVMVSREKLEEASYAAGLKRRLTEQVPDFRKQKKNEARRAKAAVARASKAKAGRDRAQAAAMAAIKEDLAKAGFGMKA